MEAALREIASMEERALWREVEIILEEGETWINFADQSGGRGSRPSESQMDDPNVMVETLESGRRMHSLSPRKQVEALENVSVQLFTTMIF